MAQPAYRITDETTALASAETIDRAHLRRMTFGDRGLEREVLELFDRQSAILIARMRSADSASVAALAHTLKGSALGVGAGGVASAAAAIELAVLPPDRSAAIDRLAEMIEAARTAIAEMLADQA
jgi:HPt (histidine-containing phosphotransfer) domain-containing protein